MNINGLMRMLIGIVMKKAVDKGIDYASRRGKPASQMTAKDHEQAKSARAMVKRARQAARITRKIR